MAKLYCLNLKKNFKKFEKKFTLQLYNIEIECADVKFQYGNDGRRTQRHLYQLLWKNKQTTACKTPEGLSIKI